MTHLTHHLHPAAIQPAPGAHTLAGHRPDHKPRNGVAAHGLCPCHGVCHDAPQPTQVIAGLRWAMRGAKKVETAVLYGEAALAFHDGRPLPPRLDVLLTGEPGGAEVTSLVDHVWEMLGVPVRFRLVGPELLPVAASRPYVLLAGEDIPAPSGPVPWPVGAEMVRDLLDRGLLTACEPDPRAAAAMMAEVTRVLGPGGPLPRRDLPGLYLDSYDAVRMAIRATLLAQGLCGNTHGGLIAEIRAVSAQVLGMVEEEILTRFEAPFLHPRRDHTERGADRDEGECMEEEVLLVHADARQVAGPLRRMLPYLQPFA